MKKPSSRIKEEIAKLQEQLKAAETREAERIGRIALEDVAKRFRERGSEIRKVPPAQNPSGAASRANSEA